MKRIGTLLIVIAVIALQIFENNKASADTVATTRAAFGTNLATVADWSSEYVFTDAFKMSRNWLTQADGVWDTKEQAALDLDENGWVKSLPKNGEAQFSYVGTLLFVGIGENYPAGQYTVIYEGEGTINYYFDAVKNEALSTDGRHIIDVTPGAAGGNVGIYMTITETDPNNTGNYIRNIRVMMPGQEGTANKFHPDFLNSIKNYEVIRYMDWQETNWSTQGAAVQAHAANMPVMQMPTQAADLMPQMAEGMPVRAQSPFTSVDWQARATVNDHTYTSHAGVPLEIMVELANVTGTDAWFNMPHQATDDYMSAFAVQVKNTLDTNNTVYVEYSNEVWNSSFGQAQWVEDAGMKQWPTSDAAPIVKRMSYFGMRTTEMCNIWKQAFGEQADRVVCVLGAQSANPWLAEQALNCPVANMDCTNVDAVAIAPYFGQALGLPENHSEVLAWTNEADGGLNSLFTQLSQGGLLTNGAPQGELQRSINDMNAYAALAANYGMDMISYEGGQHLVGVGSVVWDEAITELFTTANRDPRMGALYSQYLTAWNNAGGGVFNHFVNAMPATMWGSWGSKEFTNDTNAPKYNAVMEYIQSVPCDCETVETTNTTVNTTPETTDTKVETNNNEPVTEAPDNVIYFPVVASSN